MKRNMRTWMNGVVNSAERKALPVLSFPGAELVGIKISDVVRKASAQYECIKAIADSYDTCASVTNMDLSVEAEAFGCEIKYAENEVPTVTKGIISSIEEAADIDIPETGTGRTFEYARAAELAVKHITDRPVFAGMIGPFSLSGRLFDMTEIMMAILTDPEASAVLLEKTTAFLIEYAKLFKKTGANGLIIAEPAAGLLSPSLCHEFSSVYVKRIVDAVQDDNFMVILHNCGRTEKQVGSLLSTGAMGFHFGNAVDMSVILPQIPWGRVALGNIDPAGVFKAETPEVVFDKTTELLHKTAIYKNFILSSGCDIPPGTPHENIRAFFDALEKFNSEEISGQTA